MEKECKSSATIRRRKMNSFNSSPVPKVRLPRPKIDELWSEEFKHEKSDLDIVGKQD